MRAQKQGWGGKLGHGNKPFWLEEDIGIELAKLVEPKLKAPQKSVVLIMGPNPKPNQDTVILDGECSMIPTYTH